MACLLIHRYTVSLLTPRCFDISSTDNQRFSISAIPKLPQATLFTTSYWHSSQWSIIPNSSDCKPQITAALRFGVKKSAYGDSLDYGNDSCVICPSKEVTIHKTIAPGLGGQMAHELRAIGKRNPGAASAFCFGCDVGDPGIFACGIRHRHICLYRPARSSGNSVRNRERPGRVPALVTESAGA